MRLKTSMIIRFGIHSLLGSVLAVQSGSDLDIRNEAQPCGSCDPQAERIIPSQCRRHAVVVAGLDADHVDVGGDRHSDCPGLVHQVTVSGDVSLHAPHLITSEVRTPCHG